MFRISVLYPKTADSHFDMSYYLNKHVPLVRERLGQHGLVRVEIDETIGTVDPTQPSPIALIGHLVFNTLEDFQSGLAAHASELLGDIPNFTNVQPQMLVNRMVE